MHYGIYFYKLLSVFKEKDINFIQVLLLATFTTSASDLRLKSSWLHVGFVFQAKLWLLCVI